MSDKIKESLGSLVEFLLLQPCAHISPSERELTFRCPFCGDSRSSSTTTSFSINIDPKSENFLRYQCFRASCLSKGVVNEEFLSMLGFSRYDNVSEIFKFNNKKNKKIGGKYISKHKKELLYCINDKNKVNDVKLKYINKRLDLDLTYNDLEDLKIILDFQNLIDYNKIQINDPKKQYYYDNLSKYGIAFISAYNDYVIVRDISKSNKLKRRYINVNIFDNYENVTKMYCIPTTIDLLSREPTVINVAEGVFDIISIYKNFDIDREYDNQIFVAACGAGIINTIIHYIKQYGIIDAKINIFSDADVDIKKYKKIDNIKKYLINPKITVYYNKLNKDFGVTPNQIELISHKI